MAKFYGEIGFAQTFEDPPLSGIWKTEIVEKKYYGDILQRRFSNEQREEVNDNLNLDVDVSIVADTYLRNAVEGIRYVKYLGSKWRVRTISVDYPRLTLSLGGVYNGDDGPTA